MGLDSFEANKNRYQEAVKNLPHLAGLGTLVYTMETNRVSMSLEAFEALTDIFKGSIEHGLRWPEGTEVFPLNKTPYREASDIAEKSGMILMQKINTEWIDA
jgi:hypothetical protein